MRLVVDTNVFISAALKETSWPTIVVRWIDRFGGLLKTPATEQEVFEVIQRPRLSRYLKPLLAERLKPIFAAAELVPIRETVTGCSDPKDDKLLELAVNGAPTLLSQAITTCWHSIFSGAFQSSHRLPSAGPRFCKLATFQHIIPIAP